MHKNCGLYKRLEHQTRECEEREDEKGVMLDKLNGPTNSEVGPMAAMIGAACGGSKEKWESDFCATFHMSHIYAEMTVYKKASPRMTVKVTDGNILSEDGAGH